MDQNCSCEKHSGWWPKCYIVVAVIHSDVAVLIKKSGKKISNKNIQENLEYWIMLEFDAFFL